MQQFVSGQADATATNPATGKATSFRRFGPGTILDAHAGVEYDFPAAGLDAANYVVILQAELRAIASRLVMPEFMLTSDASNANYSSTMMAEGPRDPHVRPAASLARSRRPRRHVARAPRRDQRGAGSPPRRSTTLEIQAAPPTLAVRDPLQEAEAYRIEFQSGILSPQTWSQKRGLDYNQEQANWAAHARNTAPASPAPGDSTPPH